MNANAYDPCKNAFRIWGAFVEGEMGFEPALRW